MTSPTYYSVNTLSNETVVREHYQFGVRDDKGRELGVIVVIARQETVEAPEDARWCTMSRLPAGIHFLAKVQMTRAGRSYGASQGLTEFASFPMAQTYVNNLVEKRRREYTKRFARKEA